MSVVIETTLGDVTVDLFTEERPQTCLNFLKLCKIKYYNLCLFHSVSANFLAQTGDPSGKGDGGESIFGLLRGSEHRLFLGEKMPKIKHDRTGLLSMVSHGDGLFGSQFIITLSGNLTSLDQEHCVFGHIVEGVELLLKLNEAITDDQHRPYQDIRITHTIILEDPFPDPEGLVIPVHSPVPPSTKDLAFSRIPADEPLNENYSQEELDEIVQQKEAAARAAILEMVGDIPDADVAPPENVLFVCKLNPLTSDHDLSLIFSRFGTVKSCEVIRDQITGDSLQYAFIEFEDKKACEDAYFKMDNVLIDDRRIHVDFSQSVAKLKWKGKGKGVEYLGPPHPGGWIKRYKSSSSRDAEINVTRSHDTKRNSNGANYRHKNYFQNGRIVRKENKIRCDKEKSRDHERQNFKKRVKIIRKKSGSTSTSGDSISETSDSSSSYSSSTSSYNKRKKHKKSRKVLVVVKTPSRGGSGKKLKKSKTKSKKHRKFETESDSSGSKILKRKNKKKGRKETTSSDSSESSSDESLRKRKKKKEHSTSNEELRIKTKRKKISETSDGSSSSEYEKFEMERCAKKKIKSRKHSFSSSETDSDQSNKRKKNKVKSKKKKLIKKKKKRH